MKKIVIVWARSVLEARLLRVANTLDEEGYSVKVFAWDREGVKEDIERHEHFDCHYLHLKSPYNSPVLFLLLPLWWILAFRFLLREKPDGIHACDLDCVLPTLFYSRLKRKPLVFDIFDIYATMVEKSIPKPLFKILLRLEHAGARASNAVIMVNESQHALLGKPPLKRKLFLINSPFEEDMDRIDARIEDYRRKIPVEHRKKKLIFYGGSLEYARRFDLMLEAIEGMDDVFHLVAGSGADGGRLVPMFEASKNTQYIGPIPFEEVLIWSRMADMLYVLCDSSKEKCRMGAQTRLYIGMMCGTPILVTAGINSARVIEENQCGFSVPDNDVEALREAIKRLAGSPDLRYRMGENGQNAYHERYSWSRLRKGLVDLYSDVL